MAESIQCWQCGTRMTLDELSANDGDCPECDVEIPLAEYLSKALAENASLRAQLPRKGGEAVAFSMSAAGLITWTADELADGKRGIRWVMDDKVYGRPTDHDCREYLAGNPNACGCPCDKCRPADQVAEGLVVSRELLENCADYMLGSASARVRIWHDQLRQLLAKSEGVKQ